ncbi:hypothetical protein [Bosea sp. (in: a-proteobacteria)]|uniref:hypothetical protein n=1 Tax=unclassified Bosea (in: a-proteobacteria) TaxID=2653178 RepID=UPI001AC74CB1|nr:hypothetical protein [Bosea sp. (in: a-proteobacteria)]MBN9444086.1 hypothetical protein [Bosea sp. (in: a-proteobacteria)]
MSSLEIGVAVAIAIIVIAMVIVISLRSTSSHKARRQSFEAPDRGYQPPNDDGGHAV